MMIKNSGKSNVKKMAVLFRRTPRKSVFAIAAI
jgi:hypothetical protein